MSVTLLPRYTWLVVAGIRFLLWGPEGSTQAWDHVDQSCVTVIPSILAKGNLAGKLPSYRRLSW